MELYKALDQFNDYWFEESTHSYTYKGNPVKGSVTQLIKTYVKPFERDYWLNKKAAQLKISKEELAAQWQQKADISTTSGTLFHEFMEKSLSGKHFVPTEHVNANLAYSNEVIEQLNLLTPIGKQFIQDTKHKLIPVKSELTIGIKDQIAGQVDQLFYNTASNELEVWDWKTNGDIHTKSPYKDKLLKELNRYDACEYTEYSLQLNLYREILRRHNIETGNCYFVWFNKKKKIYVCYKCLDLSMESKYIVDNIS